MLYEAQLFCAAPSTTIDPQQPVWPNGQHVRMLHTLIQTQGPALAALFAYRSWYRAQQAQTCSGQPELPIPLDPETNWRSLRQSLIALDRGKTEFALRRS